MVVGVLDKKIIGIIPARYQSSRLPGKPLKDIHGKPMIYWVAKRVEASILKEYYVATDDNRIFNTCKKYSIPCVMTSVKCANGTERVAEVATKIMADYYVNIQGDEPCIEIDAINTFVRSLQEFDQVDFIQAVSKITDQKSILDDSVVKVALTENNEILYYSRLPIPYSINKDEVKNVEHYRCLGLYLYDRDFLKKYLTMNSTKLENIERIEQLRILENKITINAVKVKDNGISVDTINDLIEVRERYNKGLCNIDFLV
jgi:3-deoxy-manno-octulosonate cytidylyltransferase (CMP-KDO synthetase)